MAATAIGSDARGSSRGSSTSTTRASSAATASGSPRPTDVGSWMRARAARWWRVSATGCPRSSTAAVEQAERISYFYNHHFTSEPQERLADRLLEVVAPEMARVRLVSGGSEANETALQLARLYHVERGETERWRVISPAQSYHGSTMGTLALNGRPRAPGAVHAVPRVAPPHPALDLAVRPDRRGGARGARPAPRGGRTRRPWPRSSASR